MGLMAMANVVLALRENSSLRRIDVVAASIILLAE
jgi:hypothetical protein